MVIPVYNAEKYIEKCADSLLQQSYTELELLLWMTGVGISPGRF